jgi:hypothetical protein
MKVRWVGASGLKMKGAWDNPSLKGFQKPATTPFKAGWRDFAGIRVWCRSKWEAQYGFYLLWLKSHGIIRDFEHEPKTFWFKDIKRGTVSYLPDYRVTNPDGSQEYHEVKGWMSPKDGTKLKRMKKYFPGIKLIVIDAEWFKRNRKKLSGLVPGWEK